ncbi:MAG: SGNH/GDSL hydrolase family protein [Porphyromonas sp.]|nr:SGNH/GDSL hydrolase family protein [Porphyromonas sp.]
MKHYKMLTLLLLSLLLCSSSALFAQVKPTIAILGDSYSTFEGFNPSGHALWYTAQKQERTDVSDVTETWWWQLIKSGGYKLGVNNSYSGATICNTGYNDKDYSDRSFVTRATGLGNPDIILVFGATNDSWADVPLGEYKYADWRRADLYTFRPAMAKMLQLLQLHYPNAEVYFIVNTGLKAEIQTSIEQICAHYRVPCIRLRDVHKLNGHPSVQGMKAIAQQVQAAIRSANRS